MTGAHRHGAGGEQVDQGDRGEQGSKGDDGTQGVAGAQGAAGPAGAAGTPGAAGLPGQGVKGDTGETGARGEPGSTGMRGPRGIDSLRTDPADVAGPLAMDFIRKMTLSVLALLTVVVSFLVFYLVTYVQEQRLLSECYRQAFTETNTALVVTVAAAARDRAGLKALLESLTDPERTREQRSADLEKYLQLLADGEADRAATPVLPARTC